MPGVVELINQLIEAFSTEQQQIVTVDSYDSGAELVYVIRNGQTTPDAAGYPHAGSYAAPAAGHYALLERVGSGYIVTAKIGPGGSAGGATIDGHVIKESGTPLTQRAGLNFTIGLVATDDSGGDETEVALGAHESNHLAGGSDPITGGQFGPNTGYLFTDITTPSAPGASKVLLYSVAGVPMIRAGAAGAETALSLNGHTHAYGPDSAHYITTQAEAGLSAEAVLGTAVIMSGVVGSIPAFGTAGRLYWATDEHILYRDSGAAWVAVGTLDLADMTEKSHASLTSLTTGDPHTQYVLDAGDTMTGALVIAVTSAAVIPATSKGASAQTGDLYQFQDSSGNVLNSFDRHGRFPNPRTNAYVWDEFLGGPSAFGQLGWGNTISGTGGISHLETAIANHPGMLRLTTGATSGSTARLYLSTTSGEFAAAELFDITFIVRPNNTTDFTLRVGVGNDASALQPNDGMYFEHLSTDTAWWGVTRAASSQNRTASAISGNFGGGYFRLRVRRIDASTIGFTADDGTEQTLAVTIPTVTMSPFFAVTNTTANAKSADIDYFDMLIRGMSR